MFAQQQKLPVTNLQSIIWNGLGDFCKKRKLVEIEKSEKINEIPGLVQFIQELKVAGPDDDRHLHDLLVILVADINRNNIYVSRFRECIMNPVEQEIINKYPLGLPGFKF